MQGALVLDDTQLDYLLALLGSDRRKAEAAAAAAGPSTSYASTSTSAPAGAGTSSRSTSAAADGEFLNLHQTKSAPRLTLLLGRISMVQYQVLLGDTGEAYQWGHKSGRVCGQLSSMKCNLNGSRSWPGWISTNVILRRKAAFFRPWSQTHTRVAANKMMTRVFQMTGQIPDDRTHVFQMTGQIPDDRTDDRTGQIPDDRTHVFQMTGHA
eukprot:1138379-Pelagomonas_calceolata.AAC.4